MHTSIRNLLKFKVGIKPLFVMLVVAGSAVLIAPRAVNIAHSENCNNAPTVATLNFFPVTWGNVAGTGCVDFAPIAVRNVNSTDYSQNLNGNSGDEFYVRIYVHDGAQQGLDPNVTTARNVNGTVSLSGNTISTNFSASNTNSVSGSVSISVPSGAHLEMEPGSGQFFDYQASPSSGNDNLSTTGGSFSFGDMQACFEFSKFYRFKVKVVGAVVTPTDSITATLGSKISGQCLWNGNVTWTSSNVTNPKVYVKSYNSVEKLMAAAATGNETVPWIDANDLVTFTLRGDNIADKIAIIDTSSLSCGTTPTKGTGTLTLTAGGQVSGQCLSLEHVSWSTSNINSALVTVGYASSDYSQEGRFGYSINGTQDANWLIPGKVYRFTLWEVNPSSGGQNITDKDGQVWNVRMLDQKTVTGPTLDCGSVSGQYNVNFDCGSVTWTSPSNVTSVDVVWQDITTHTVSKSLPSTSPNGSGTIAPLTNGSVYYFIIYDTSNGGHTKAFEKTTPVYDSAACGVTPPPVTLNCAAGNSSYNIGDSATFTATGGKSPYSWTSNTASPYSGSGSVFNTSYATSGTKTASVTSADGQTASCSTYINKAVVPTLTCSAGSSSYNIYDLVSFTATGGNGSYSWKNPDGLPTVGIGSLFGAVYSISGTKTVVVTSGDGQTASCSTYINKAVVPTLTCSAGSASYNIGDSATFTATGGKSPYSWTSNTASPYSGSGSVFNTSYATSGTKTASVTSADGQTASCSTYINKAVVPTLTCSAGSSSYNVSDIVIFTATGGSGSYSWSATGGIPSSGTSNSFSTTYATSGTKTVVVTSGDGQTASCSTSINTVVIPGTTINLVKMVKNITKGDSGYSHSTNAVQGDTVQYQIQVSSASAVALTNTVVTDTFASGINYVDGSLMVNGQPHAVGLFGSGLSFDSIGQNPVIITYKATVAISSGSIINTAKATASNANNSASDQAVVTVTSQPVTPVNNGGDCNGSKNSCNNNTNNNTQASSGNNSANQNNQNNVNGDNNTVTSTNNNCVNNSCNNTNTYYYYASSNGINYQNPVPYNQYLQLSITKYVRDLNGGAYQKSVSVISGSTVQFEIDVTNTGNQQVNNVTLNDPTVAGLNWISGSTQVDGSYVSNWNGNSLSLGSLSVGQTRKITFQATVYSTGNVSIQNVASVYGDSVPQQQDDAWVFVTSGNGNVLGGSVNLVYSKKAWNDTKNADATTIAASKEDYVTYTLTVTNNGNSPADNFIITDDLSQVLPYADIADNGGGTVSGNIINYPGISVPAGGSVSKSFRVRVKYFLADNLHYTMTNTYGNTIVVNINSPSTQVLGAFVAPKTGADTNAFAFAGIMVAAFAVAKKRQILLKLIGM